MMFYIAIVGLVIATQNHSIAEYIGLSMVVFWIEARFQQLLEKKDK